MLFKRNSRKKCSRCGEFKSLDSFGFRDKEHTKMRGICKECENHHKANWYQKNRETHIENVAKRKKITKEEVRGYIDDYLRSHPCVHCGNSDPRVLEFDHIRGKKRHNVSRMAAQGYSIRIVKKEIAKCQVLCANCHRIKHANERGWFSR